jgi:IS5 family transposase
VRVKGLAKNTVQVATPFALSNPWMARKELMAKMGVVRAQSACTGKKRCGLRCKAR